MVDKIALEIITASYWEHFKASKDLALLYPPTHPKRIKLLEVINELQIKMNNE